MIGRFSPYLEVGPCPACKSTFQMEVLKPNTTYFLCPVCGKKLRYRVEENGCKYEWFPPRTPRWQYLKILRIQHMIGTCTVGFMIFWPIVLRFFDGDMVLGNTSTFDLLLTALVPLLGQICGAAAAWKYLVKPSYLSIYDGDGCRFSSIFFLYNLAFIVPILYLLWNSPIMFHEQANLIDSKTKMVQEGHRQDIEKMRQRLEEIDEREKSEKRLRNSFTPKQRRMLGWE